MIIACLTSSIVLIKLQMDHNVTDPSLQPSPFLCKEIIFFLRSCDISLQCGAIADSMKWEGVFFK